MRVGETCPKCGAAITRPAKFCPGCGTAATTSRGGTMSFGKVVGVFLLVCVIAVFIVGGCAAIAATTTPSDSMKQSKAPGRRWKTSSSGRYDLIPNLVESVKGIAGQEQEVFLGIAKARESYFQARSTARKGRRRRSL